MIDIKYASSIVKNFFNKYQNSNTDLIDFFAFFLDVLQQENFKNEKVTPLNFINNLNEFIDIDKRANKNLFSYLIPTEIESIINKTIGWQNFVKISKKIYNSKSKYSNFTFFLDLISDYDISFLFYDDPDDISIFKKMNINPSVYSKGKTLYPIADERIPNILKITNVQLKDNFTTEDLTNIIKFVKPIGVVILLFTLLNNQSIDVTIEHKTRLAIDYSEYLKINPYFTDIGEFVENIYTKNDHILFEIRNVNLIDMIETDSYLFYGYMPDNEILDNIDTYININLNVAEFDLNTENLSFNLNDMDNNLNDLYTE